MDVVKQLWAENSWKIRAEKEHIRGAISEQFLVLTVLGEPKSFSRNGNGNTSWPIIFRVPKLEGIGKGLLIQAVLPNFRLFLSNVPEVMAIRGFPDDPTGVGTGEVLFTVTQYISSRTEVEFLTLLVPKLFRYGPIKPAGSQRNSSAIPLHLYHEIFAVVYVKNQRERDTFRADLSLQDLGSYRDTQSLNGWTVQLASSLDYVREAHPDPLLQRYMHCKVGAFKPGTDITQVFNVLNEDPYVNLDPIFSFYMERDFLDTREEADTESGDFLICVYPHQSAAPAILGSAELRALCVPDLFGIKDTGLMVPGWARVRDFYLDIINCPGLPLDPRLNRTHTGSDREGFHTATQGTSMVVTRSPHSVHTAVQAPLDPRDRTTHLTRKEIGQIAQAAVAHVEARLQQMETKAAATVAMVEEKVATVEQQIQTLHQTAATKEDLNRLTTSTAEAFNLLQHMLDSMRTRLTEFERPRGPANALLYREDEDHDTVMEDGEAGGPPPPPGR